MSTETIEIVYQRNTSNSNRVYDIGNSLCVIRGYNLQTIFQSYYLLLRYTVSKIRIGKLPYFIIYCYDLPVSEIRICKLSSIYSYDTARDK